MTMHFFFFCNVLPLYILSIILIENYLAISRSEMFQIKRLTSTSSTNLCKLIQTFMVESFHYSLEFYPVFLYRMW